MSTVMTDPGSGGGQSPPAPPPPRRLTRRSDRRVLAGVAGGIADYFTIDPVILRIAFVVLAVTGAGVLLYLLGWLFIPREDQGASIAERSFRRLAAGPRWLAAILIVVGAVVLLSHSRFWAPSIVWGLALIALGVVLYTREGEPETPLREPPATPVPTEGLAQPVSSEVSPAALPVPSTMAAAPTRPRRPPRERSAMGWFVVGGVLAAVGMAAVLDELGAISLRPVQYMALALTVLGVGLLVSAWVGRARWLILLCLLLVPFVAIASLIHVPIRGGFGDHAYVPASVADVSPEYRLIAGRLYLNLSQVRFGPGPTTVRASVVAGQIEVLVPHDVQVVLSGTVGAGTVHSFAAVDQGLSVPVRGDVTAPPRAPVLNLDLSVSFGRVSIDRAPATG